MKKAVFLLILLILITIGAGFAFSFNKKADENKGETTMNKKILVAYFSATGITKAKAQALAEAIGADTYEIKPKIPYTKEDLDWMDKNSRTTLEMKDKSSRPELADKNANIENYDEIFLGFPIWWYVAPTIVNTFLESYDFSNKKIILFATSGGSGFGETLKYLQTSAPKAQIIEGKLLNGAFSKEELKSWAQKF